MYHYGTLHLLTQERQQNLRRQAVQDRLVRYVRRSRRSRRWIGGTEAAAA